MKPDEERAVEVREWLKKAEEDLGSAGILMVAGRLGHALFCCQQAAEKSLKGFLTWHERGFRKTHDLEEIGQGCAEVDPSLSNL